MDKRLSKSVGDKRDGKTSEGDSSQSSGKKRKIYSQIRRHQKSGADRRREPEFFKKAALRDLPKVYGPSEKTVHLSAGDSSDTTDLSYFLPELICRQYAVLGKSSNLFEWQAECLSRPGVMEGRNVVYCAPTSAGKSLVAEILMLHQITANQKAAMLVLPFVSLCNEKSNFLEVLLKPICKKVRRFYGNYSSWTVIKEDTGILVCTIEKANMLINRMIEEGNLDQLGIVVVDELHMVDDLYRGYLLELLLTKLMYMAKKSKTLIQIVGMSATMPNGSVVAQWLDAELYETTTRPIPLRQYLKVKDLVFDENGRAVRELPPQGTVDPDHLAWLTNETVSDGHSVLIFCCSKKMCEVCAEHISKLVSIPPRDAARAKKRESLAKELDLLVGNHREALKDLIGKGVAFHHAGLSSEERTLVETAYKAGAVSVLAATSTLAAGVNLPARRVIFREPYIGKPDHVLDATSYRQMAGRAGRAGIDEEGEAYLLESKFVDTYILQKLIQCDARPVSSCISRDKNGMFRLLLEAITSGAVKTGNDVQLLINCSLLAQMPNSNSETTDSAFEALEWLKKNQLIKWHLATASSPGIWVGSGLSDAIVSSSMDPHDCAIVKKELKAAMHHLVLSSDLHLAFLSIPFNVEIVPNWQNLCPMFNKLSVIDSSIADLVGVSMNFLHSTHVGIHTDKGSEEAKIVRRFYIALILKEVVNEVPVSEICAKFGLTHGAIETLQEKAARHAGMSASFCGSLGWTCLQAVLMEFQKRITGGARPEIAHLTQIPFVKAHRARLLIKHGYRSIEAVAEAAVERLSKVFAAEKRTSGDRNGGLDVHMARKIIRGARTVLQSKLDSLEEEGLATAEIIAAEPTGLVSEDLSDFDGEAVTSKKAADPIEEAERKLTNSMKRLSFDLAPFVSVQGIIVLQTDLEATSLSRFLSERDIDHVSIAVGYSEAVDEKMVGVSLCWDEDRAVFVHLDDPNRINLLSGLISNANVIKSTFDLDVLDLDLTCRFASLMDVASATKLLKRSDPKMRDLAGLYSLFEMEEEYIRTKEFFSASSIEACNEYQLVSCCSEASLTWTLWRVIKEELSKTGQLEFFLERQMPYKLLIESMSEEGVWLDKRRTEEVIGIIERRLTELRSVMDSLTRSSFDPWCESEVDFVLFRKLQLGRPRRWKEEPDSSLRLLQDYSPVPSLILVIRLLLSAKENLLVCLGDSEGDKALLAGELFKDVCHYSVENEHEISQALPLHDVKVESGVVQMSVIEDELVEICDCLYRRDRYVVLKAEYTSLDLWLLAHFSQDEGLLYALQNSRGDPVRAIAGRLYGCPPSEYHKMSQISVAYFEKFLSGFLHGASPLLLGHILEVSENRATVSYQGFLDTFKGLRTWIEQISRAAAATNSIRTLSYRLLPIEVSSDVERLATRSVLQGSVKDILKESLISLHLRLEYSDCRVIRQTERGFLIEVPLTDMASAIQTIKEAMADALSLNVEAPAMIQVKQI